MLVNALFGIEVEAPKCSVGATHWALFVSKATGAAYCCNCTVTKVSKSGKHFGFRGINTHTGKVIEADFINWCPIDEFRPFRYSSVELENLSKPTNKESE